MENSGGRNRDKDWEKEMYNNKTTVILIHDGDIHIISIIDLPGNGWLPVLD